MSKDRLLEILLKNPSYTTIGIPTLSKRFNVSKRFAKAVRNEARDILAKKEPEVKYDIPVVNIHKVTQPMKTEVALKFVAETLIKEGKYNEAIDVLTKAKNEKIRPTYTPSVFNNGSYFIFGCTHLPFHNKAQWEAQCKMVAECDNLQGIILAGDILDMHSISRHSKGKIRLKGYTLGREYKEANEALDMLDAAIGDRKIKKEYFYGNHEDWYNAWGKDVDNDFLGEAGAMSPYDACFKHRGYNTQFNWKVANVKLGDLEIIHGEWCNKHAAHKHATEMHNNIAFFHTHRMSTYFESNIAGYNCGWGGDKTSPVFSYMSRPQKDNWRNGCLHVHLEDGISYPTILDFKEGKYFYNGKTY